MTPYAVTTSSQQGNPTSNPQNPSNTAQAYASSGPVNVTVNLQQPQNTDAPVRNATPWFRNIMLAGIFATTGFTGFVGYQMLKKSDADAATQQKILQALENVRLGAREAGTGVENQVRMTGDQLKEAMKQNRKPAAAPDSAAAAAPTSP